MFFKVVLFVTFEKMLERRLYDTKLIFGFGRTKNGTRANLSPAPPPPRPLQPRSFTRAIFRAVFDSRSSFFDPKPHGNDYYAG